MSYISMSSSKVLSMATATSSLIQQLIDRRWESDLAEHNRAHDFWLFRRKPKTLAEFKTWLKTDNHRLFIPPECLWVKQIATLDRLSRLATYANIVHVSGPDLELLSGVFR